MCCLTQLHTTNIEGSKAARRILAGRELLEKGLHAVCIAATHEQGLQAGVEQLRHVAGQSI